MKLCKAEIGQISDVGTSQRPYAPQCQECWPWSSLEGMSVIMMDDDMQSDDQIGLGGHPKVYSAHDQAYGQYDDGDCFETATAKVMMMMAVVVVA